MANTTTTQVSDAVNNWLADELLTRAYPYFVHALWGQVQDIPRNNSSTVKFRRYTNLTAATTALTEGISPNGSQLAITDVTAQVAQYGRDEIAVLKFFLISLFSFPNFSCSVS